MRIFYYLIIFSFTLYLNEPLFSDVSREYLREAVHNSWNWPSIHYALQNDQFEAVEELMEIFPEEASLRSPDIKVVDYWANSSDWTEISHHHEGSESGMSALELALIKKQPNLALMILQLTQGKHVNERRKEFRGEFINSWKKEIHEGGRSYRYEMVNERVKCVESIVYGYAWCNSYIETTPLYWAILMKEPALVEAFLDLKVDLKHIYYSNKVGSSLKAYCDSDFDALDVAALSGDLNIFRKVIFYQNLLSNQRLIDEQEIPNDDLQRLYELVKSNPGRSLFQAMEDNDVDSFQLLVSYGYGIDYFDRIDHKHGKSLFTLAWEHENLCFLGILRECK